MSSRTIVVFEAGSKLLYTELSDYEAVPAIGYVLEHDGAAYSVVEPWMSPAVYLPPSNEPGADHTKETKRTGLQKLVKILAVISGDELSAYALLASMESIGSADRPEISSGGIIKAAPSKLESLPKFDDVIYLRTKKLKTKGKTAIIEKALIERLSAAGHADFVPAGAASGENIVLTADAEG